MVNLSIKEMFENGLHYGHRKSQRGSKMSKLIFNPKAKFHYLDLNKSIKYFSEALEFVYQLKKEKKKILFVGTKLQAKEIIADIADIDNDYSVTEKWVGGLLTNFNNIKQRISYYKKLEVEKELTDKYTKKELSKLNTEFEKLNDNFKGLRNMTKKPDAIFVVDTINEWKAINEGNKLGIPLIGICDTNSDPSKITFPIYANDDSVTSLKYIFSKVKEVIELAKNIKN